MNLIRRLLSACVAACALALSLSSQQLLSLEGPWGGPASTVRRTKATTGPAKTGVENGYFFFGLRNWNTSQRGGGTNPGSVSVQNGEALLLEGDSFLVSLSQAVTLDGSRKELSFDYRLVPGFDRTANQIPDAFEVHLLDANQRSVVPTWDTRATSFFNVQEDGRLLLGSATKVQSGTVTLDLSALQTSGPLTIVVDLIGADADRGSGVRIDNINASCGVFESYGKGLAGTGGKLPVVSGSGCPRLGQTVRITVADVVGAGKGCFFIGLEKDTMAMLGGVRLVKPLVILGHITSGSPGRAGAGRFDVDFTIPVLPSFVDFEAFFQAIYLDTAAPQGVSFSQGLRMTVR